MKRKPKVSLNPQHINKNCWYYENPGNIEIYTDTGLAGKISKRKLKASLRRMGS